ncbi:MAG TPA: PQQ-binding-like beta-propeller repeat protein [Fimbriimonadaceae bacterium]|nr:PQQ-binding-like beta-propeller repeat protein [Fimbriimonadaceae bacterium]
MFAHLANLFLILLLGLGAPPADLESWWKAAREGDAPRIQALLAAGVDPNTEFRDGGTALLFASQRGHVEAVRMLVEHGANVNAYDDLNGTTALTFALGHPEVVQALVDHGGNPDLRDFQMGQTTLYWGVVLNDARSVKILLASGRNGEQSLREALDVAQKLKRTELAQAIEARMTPQAGISGEAAAGHAAIANWPQFRGPGATGIAVGEHPPTQWSVDPPQHFKWKTEIPGLGHSSPVVWGNRIFVTTAVSSQKEPELGVGFPMASAKDMSPHSWRVYCLDSQTGKILWQRVAYEGPPKTKRNPRNSFASPTPTTDGRHLLVMFGSQGLYCYDLEGNLLWKQDLGIIDSGFYYDPEYQWGDASSPILYKGMVILQCDQEKGSFLAAFDLETGERRWTTPREEFPSWGTPTLYQGSRRTELITNGIQQLRGYDPETGVELWHMKTYNSMIAAATPVANQDLIVIGNGHRPLQPLYAIKAGASGDLSLGDAESNSSVAWSKKIGGPYYVTPLIYGENLYVLQEGGVLTSYYLRTGEQIYRHRVGSTGATFAASPVAANGNIYLASESGEVYVIQAGNEYKEVAVNPVGELITATPAIAGNTIFIRTSGAVFALGNPPVAAPTGKDNSKGKAARKKHRS